jgi:hypothetical protein
MRSQPSTPPPSQNGSKPQAANSFFAHSATSKHPTRQQKPNKDSILQTPRHPRSNSSYPRNYGPRRTTATNLPNRDDSQHSDTDIMRSYAIDTLFDSAYYTGDTEEIETIEALRAPDRTQFIEAIKTEVHSLISETRTLQPLTKTATGHAENLEQRRVWKIRTTLKCKRKKKPNGEPDKHKARAAAQGDTLRRAMLKAHVPLRASYSPMIMPLTFSLFLQLAVMRKLHMATTDIKSALPPDSDWIITTLEPHIAEVCGLDPLQEYRICNALYGLPDSGRLFYLHYKAALLTEGYRMPAFDNCLFFRTTATETSYIIVYVDDTFIFSNCGQHRRSHHQHRQPLQSHLRP